MLGAALLWLLTGLFLAAVASVFILPWFWPRPTAPDIPDPRGTAPEPNGFDVLREAVDQMPPAAVGEERQPADPALEAALATLDRAVAREDWWWPSDDAPGLEPGASLKVMWSRGCRIPSSPPAGPVRSGTRSDTHSRRRSVEPWIEHAVSAAGSAALRHALTRQATRRAARDADPALWNALWKRVCGPPSRVPE